MSWPLLLLIACSRAPSGFVEDQPLEVSRGDGYALAVPAGSRVRVEADHIAVDAADGSRWFDARWVTAPDSAQAALTAHTNGQCDSVRWDRVAQPTPETLTISGLCPINTRRHWLLVTQEVHGDRTLVTVYTAAADHLTFEDAWVDFLRTAATLSPGPEPLEAYPPADIRRRLRDVANAGGIGHDPVPGGGELSPRMSESIPEVWARKIAAGAPRLPGG